MFNIFNKNKYSPSEQKSVESYGASGNIAFSNDDRTWEEEFNLIDGLVEQLHSKDIECKVMNDWIVVDGCIYLKPEITSFQPREPCGVSTTSIITICHKDYSPKGFFEYQHAIGDSTQESFNSGFESWINIDLPAIREAFSESISECMKMQMSYDDSDKKRTVILSPVSHLATENIDGSEEEHPFCPCCLITNTFEAFRKYFEQEETIAIRLLAARDENGIVSADCRINGIDYQEGESALIRYAESWPYKGYEMRKQYVVIK